MSSEKNQYLLPVLLYHRLINKNSKTGKHKIWVKESDFEKQMRYLKDNEYETITFADLDKDPGMDLYKKIILTFDDGYEDNYTLLFPILKKYNFKAVIYLVTGLRYNEWGVKEGEPALNMMSPEEVMEMSAYGNEMGGHTRNHVDLLKCTEEEIRDEIKGSKEDVEQLTGTHATSFAYPYGAHNEHVKHICKKAGYRFAVATKSGPLVFTKDLFQIRRIEVTPKTTLRSFKNKASGMYFHPNLFERIFKKQESEA